MRLKTYLCMVCLSLFSMAAIQAQTQYIGPNGGDWFTAANWNNGLPANGNDPLIGGGVSVTIGAPLTIDFSITNFGGIVAEADITNNGTISNSGTFDVTATGSLTNNATFNNFNTSTIAGPATFANEAGASFTNGGTFTLNTTLENRGSVTNNGTINAAAGTLITEGNFDNAQVLTTESLTVQNGSTFTNNFGSVLNITGAAAELTVDGNFNNLGNVTANGAFTVNGTFSNSSTVTSTGVLTINAGGTFNNNNGTVNIQSGTQNFGTFINGFQLINTGSFNNFGQFNNNNLIDNQIGATFNNRPSGTISMGFGSRVANAGSFTNENAFDSFGTIENDGAFNNSGNINSFSGSLVDNNSDFTNNGSISTNDQVLLDGPFTNNGTINVNGGSIWRNNSNFTNSTSGTVNVQQDFANQASGNVTNNGRWTNIVRTRNEGAFTNNALFEILSENLTNTAGATFINNELLLLLSGNLRNEGTLTNNDLVQSDECSTFNNTGTIDNQGVFTLHAILFQTGTLTGSPIDCQGCYVHTSSDSNAPSVCQNGTFGADINGEVKVYAPELIAFANFDSCANIVYLADGVDRPVFSCSDIGTTITTNIVLRTRLNDSLTCTAEITPVDILEPQFDSCPRDIVIFTPSANESATWTEPTAIDNCTTTSLTNNFNPGDSFPIGITGVTYTATDTYGNENNCQFRVDVRQTGAGGSCNGDTDAPTFPDCPDDIVVNTSQQSIAVGWTPPTPVDACYPLTLNSAFAPGQSFGVGSTTVIYTATDGNNNEGTCEFTVTVNFDNPCLTDNVPPSFTNCPANIYQPTNPNTGGAVAVWSEPGIFDLCGLASVTATNASGEVFPEGTNNVTYTAEDNSGNVSTCNFIVTVGANPCIGDVAPPFFANCPSNVNVVTTGNSGVATWSIPTATSTCNPVTINSNFSPGATFQLGVTPIVYTASDLVGNVSTCTFNVIVQNDCQADAVSPVISNCPADISVAANGSTGTATWTAPTAEDNCQLTTFISSFQPGASFPIGVTTVIYTAADLQGNIATCEFNVSVVEAPGCTQNAAPIEGTINVDPTSVDLSWITENQASGYNVFLGTSNPPTTQVASNVNGTSTTVSGLQGGTTYFWYVVPVNAAGSATGCQSTATSFNTSGDTGGGDCGRLTNGLVALYEFRDGNGTTVKDVSGVGTPEDLHIQDAGNVSWLGSCGLSINQGTVIQSAGAASKITSAIMATNEMTIEAWVTPANNTQAGPARIATLSSNTGNRNFTLGQDGNNYIARLRTSSGGTYNGLPTVSSNGALALQLQHVVYTRDASGNEKIFVDGIQTYSGVRSGNLGNWEASYRFAIGNELTQDRPWLGEVYLVAVYDRVFTSGDVSQNLSVGACCTPSSGGDCNFDALFVVGNSSLNAGDAYVKNRLESLGFNVTVVDDDQSQTSDADGKGLIVISSTISSGKVNTKYRDVAVPVINWESYLYDDMRMTGTGAGSNYGNYSSTSQMVIENSSHPLAAGLSGTPTVFTSNQSVTWGKPTSSATVIGSIPGNSSRKMLFAYDTGDAMVGGLAAPARRVGIFLRNSTSDNLNTNGLALFDAAVYWASGTAAPGSSCNDGNPSTANDVILSDGCTCAGTPVCDGSVDGFLFFGLNGSADLPLQDGGSYALNELPNSYNIQALVSGTSESANFQLNGPVSIDWTENFIPYHLNGDPNPVYLVEGDYTLTVTLFSEDLQGGAVCSQTTISFTIEPENPCGNNSPVATAAGSNATCGQNDGAITFTFPDHPTRTGIEFSLDGGNTYPFWSPDDAGSLTVNNLAAGSYDVYVRWGNNECPVDIGIINIGDDVASPDAVCQNIALQQTSNGQALQINGNDVDGGSTAGCGSISSLNVSPNSFNQPGIYTVTLTVTNSFGLSSTCNATVTVNEPAGPCPVDVVFDNHAECQVEVYWFDGANENLYYTLNSGQSYTQGTFDTHIWRVRNAANGNLILEYVTDGCDQQEVTIDNCGTEICKGPNGTGLTREVWEGISGVFINDLTSNANYPDNPSYSDVNAGSTGPNYIADNYGTRVRGFITPAYSGTYTFYVTGDDHTELYLSSDANPNNASLIANIYGWTQPTQYYKYASQKSVSIQLTAGQDYYVELLHKEGGGGDHWGIHWTTSNGDPYPISLDQLSPISSDCDGGVACNTEVLFVVGNTSLNSGDTWVNNRLATLGYNVELVDDDYVQTEDANGKGLVIISSTVSSGKVGNKFTNSSVPVLTWEAWLLDNLQMTGPTSGYDYGNTGSQNSLTINDPSHPLSAGLSGTVQVFTYNNSMNWGWVNNSSAASRVALVGNGPDYGILAYDEGDALFNGASAPAKRVSLWLNNTAATLLNSNGVALFDAAVNWAASCNESFAGGIGDRSSSLDLAAAKNDFDVELVWLSNTADIDELFIVERSADGENWEPILTIDSKMSNDQYATYRLMDEQPLVGKNYYRVIGERMDGTKQNSSIAEVFFLDLDYFAAFPNPARDYVYVDMSMVEGEEVLVRLFDAKGVTVQQWEVIATDEPTKLELNQKQSGQYMLWMYVDDRRPVTRRLILERN